MPQFTRPRPPLATLLAPLFAWTVENGEDPTTSTGLKSWLKKLSLSDEDLLRLSVELDYMPLSPGDLVAVKRTQVTIDEGERGYLVRQYWNCGQLVCVIQLFDRLAPSSLLIEDLRKISNT